MKVLIAGTGFIGSELADKLGKDQEVTTLDIDEADIKQDITESFELEEEFDIVFHTIGLAPGFYSEEMYRKVHVDGTQNLLDAVQCEKVVYISALNADKNTNPFFTTKFEAEKLVKESKFEHTVVRPSVVYGEENKLVNMLRRAAKTRVFPSISSQIQPIVLKDLVKLLVKSIEDYDGETINAAGPKKMTVTEFARNIYREEGYPLHSFYFPDRPMQLSFKVLDRLPQPLNYSQLELLKQENTTDENHVANIFELQKVFMDKD